MKLGVRRKYFLWLILLTLLCTLFNYGADLAYDILSGEFEEPGQQLSIRNETKELIFFLAASAAAMTLTAVVGWFIARRIARPIVELAHTARTLDGAATGAIRPEMDGGDELEDIARSLTEAFRRFDTLLTSARRFNSHAAHQLRAPLAAMRTVGECTLSRPLTAESMQETLSLMLERTDQMTRMVDRLLSYSELSIGDCRQDFAIVDINEVVSQVCDIFRPLAEAKLVTLCATLAAPIHVRGSSVLLAEMLGNLVDNAIRYTPEQGSVNVTVRRATPQALELIVADTGAGMSPAQCERVMDRFRDRDAWRSADNGLGLPIAAEIATLHEATIAIRPGEPSGTWISILIPTAEGPAGAGTRGNTGAGPSTERRIST